jgi:hypothetical protein
MGAPPWDVQTHAKAIGSLPVRRRDARCFDTIEQRQRIPDSLCKAWLASEGDAPRSVLLTINIAAGSMNYFSP